MYLEGLVPAGETLLESLRVHAIQLLFGFVFHPNSTFQGNSCVIAGIKSGGQHVGCQFYETIPAVQLARDYQLITDFRN